jgi:hypothetical protein
MTEGKRTECRHYENPIIPPAFDLIVDYSLKRAVWGPMSDKNELAPRSGFDPESKP